MRYALLVAFLATNAWAKTDGAMNRVAKVDVEASPLGRVVDISCEGDPVFTVFRLADPVRLVIDIARGDVSKLDGPIEVSDGVIGDIATAQFADDRHALGRLIIGLEKAYDYEVKQAGKHIRVTVRAAGVTPVALGKSAGITKLAKADAPAVNSKATAVAKPEAVVAKADTAVSAGKTEPVVVKDAAPAKGEPTQTKPEPTAAKTDQMFAKAQPATGKSELTLAKGEPVVAKAEPTPAKHEPAPVVVSKPSVPVVAKTATVAPVVTPAIAKPLPLVAVAPAKPESTGLDFTKDIAQNTAKQPTTPRTAVALGSSGPELTQVRVGAQPKELPVQQMPSQVVVDKLMDKVAVHRRKTGSDVFIRIKGGKPAYEVLELENPPRVVFDFIGVATKLPKRSEWNLGEIGKLRLGIHEDKVRMVLDGTTGVPKYEVIVDDKGIQITTELMPSKAAPAPALVAEKPTPMLEKPAPVADKPAPLLAKVVPTPVAAPVSPLKEPVKEREVPAVAPVAQASAPAAPPLAKALQPASPIAPIAKAPLPVAPAPVAVTLNAPVNAAPAPVKAPVAVAKPSAQPQPPAIAALPLQAPLIRTTQINQLDFKKSGDIARLSFALPESAQYDLDRSIDRAPTLTVTNAELTKTLEKASDVSSLGTAVTRLTSFNDRQGKGLRIVANLNDTINHRVFRENGQLVWEFTANSKPPQALVAQAPVQVEKPVEISMKPVPEVAGFSAEAAQMMRSTTMAQSNSRRINIDVRGADLLNVLRLISDVSGENIVAGDDVTGKITLRLRNVPWEQALDAALKTKGYGRVRSGTIIRVAPLDKLQKEKEAEIARIKADEQIQPTFVRLIPINYAQAKDILEQVRQLLTKDRGKATVDERTNTIVAEDLLEVLNKIEGLARRLDTQTPQVLIESRIVEANTQHVRDIGIQWGGSGLFSPATGNATGLAFPNLLGFGGGADSAGTNTNGTADPGRFAVNLPAPVAQGSGGAVGLIFGNASNTGLLSLRLSALENNGSVRIVSAPKVTTLDNVRARISQGTSIPISVTSAAGVNTRFVDAFLELEVKPHVTQDGSIMMEIRATKNEPNFSRTGSQGDPTIDKKVAETQVLVKDGDTTVIGGIYTRNTATTFNEIPFISKIPVLGWLFKRKRTEDSRAELLVFITPRIVNRQQSSVVAGGGL